MGWVNWLKGLAERPGDAADDKPARRAAAGPRRGRKGGEAYAREWVKVLEDSTPGRDPNGTYTWELHAEDAPPAEPPQPASRAPVAKGRGQKADDPFDTYTWEVQETDDRDDPWGLKRDEPPKKVQRDGVNPYDTGIFDASWTGRFDKR
jgi:hypothetical protein